MMMMMMAMMMMMVMMMMMMVMIMMMMMMMIVREGAESIVERLCGAGADMTSSSSGEPPLWLALEAENTDLASILVRHGVDTDHWAPGPEDCSQTLLHR